jgi:hypothetical protein
MLAYRLSSPSVPQVSAGGVFLCADWASDYERSCGASGYYLFAAFDGLYVNDLHSAILGRKGIGFVLKVTFSVASCAQVICRDFELIDQISPDCFGSALIAFGYICRFPWRRYARRFEWSRFLAVDRSALSQALSVAALPWR